MICYRFDNSSCQYLDLNNELSEWKEVSIPIKNGVSSLAGHDRSTISLSYWDGFWEYGV